MRESLTSFDELAHGTAIRRILLGAAVFGMLILGLLLLAFMGLGTGLAGLLVGMVLAVLPVPFYLLLALWIDRYEKEPVGMLALAFLWGATVAAFFSFLFNTVSALLLGEMSGSPQAAELGGAVLSAPFSEELSKGVALFILYFWKRNEFDNITDGIIYAAMVGLGFAMTENVLYYGRAIQTGFAGSLVTIGIRGVLAPFSHPLYTAMTGIGLGLARESTNRMIKLAAPVLGLAMAMFLHALWNLAASLGPALVFVYFLIMVPIFLALIGLVVYSLRREGGIIRRHLSPYAERGELSPAELETLSSVRGRLGEVYEAFREGGFRRWRDCQLFHQSASELAFYRWRVERGFPLDEEETASFEREHLEIIREYRGGQHDEA
ncbi:MAG: PrsW family intramembrane metalloprotease [Gemmatimonadetes bacterium]|nr:PrsW family intramembrane metalloprotease [Gemmatimonadota bacterium]